MVLPVSNTGSHLRWTSASFCYRDMWRAAVLISPEVYSLRCLRKRHSCVIGIGILSACSGISYLGEVLVVRGLLNCFWGADDRSDWTARLAAAGRAPMIARSPSPALTALPDFTDTIMSSAASSTLQHPVQAQSFPL